MLTYGNLHCQNLQSATVNYDTKLLSTYYDGEWVFRQIGDYTQNPSWYNCANLAEAIYRDQYVNPAGAVVPGYWNFPHGLAHDYLSTGDTASRSAAIALSQNASYAADYTPVEWTADQSFSREVAYGIMSYLIAEDLGQPRRARLAPLVEQAFGHMDQWFVSHTASWMRPFMVALTSHALILYHERVGDSRVIPTLTLAMDALWDTMWLPASQAFKYTDRETSTGGQEPAPDLNLLIAPVYAWLYHQTGEVRFRERFDAIFVGGVQQAYLVNGKQFNQNYRLSIWAVGLRQQVPLH